MCKKSPAVNYVFKKISTTSKSEILQKLEDSPLSLRDISLMKDLINGLSLTELSSKYNLTPSAISKWKRKVCEKLHTFDVANFKR